MQGQPPIPHDNVAASSLTSKTGHRDFKGASFDVPFYTLLCEEINFPMFGEAHALLTYALNVGQIREETSVRYVGELTQKPNFRQAFKTTALIYGCEPETMVKFWPIVDIALQYLCLKPITGTEERQCDTPVATYHSGEEHGAGILDELGRIIS